jgi:hypothetical protein
MYRPSIFHWFHIIFDLVSSVRFCTFLFSLAVFSHLSLESVKLLTRRKLIRKEECKAFFANHSRQKRYSKKRIESYKFRNGEKIEKILLVVIEITVKKEEKQRNLSMRSYGVNSEWIQDFKGTAWRAFMDVSKLILESMEHLRLLLVISNHGLAWVQLVASSVKLRAQMYFTAVIDSLFVVLTWVRRRTSPPF